MPSNSRALVPLDMFPQTQHVECVADLRGTPAAESAASVCHRHISSFPIFEGFGLGNSAAAKSGAEHNPRVAVQLVVRQLSHIAGTPVTPGSNSEMATSFRFAFRPAFHSIGCACGDVPWVANN